MEVLFTDFNCAETDETASWKMIYLYVYNWAFLQFIIDIPAIIADSCAIISTLISDAIVSVSVVHGRNSMLVRHAKTLVCFLLLTI